MSDELRLARYLQTLSQIQPSQVHELRTRLGVVTLQLGLLEEWIQRLDPSGTDVRTHLEPHVKKAQAGLRELHALLERILAQTRLEAEDDAELDLGALLLDLEARLASFGRERGVGLSLTLPARPLRVVGGRDATRMELLTTLVGRLASSPPGARLPVTLESSGGIARLKIGEDAAAMEIKLPLASPSA